MNDRNYLKITPPLAQTVRNQLYATKAATRAGYSEKIAAKLGARLLVNVKVAEAVAKAQLLKKTSVSEVIAKAQSKRSEITYQNWLQRQNSTGTAFSPVMKCYGSRGRRKSPKRADKTL